MYDQLSAFMLSLVRIRFAALALFPVFLVIGGCGGSSHASSSSTDRASSTSTSAQSTSTTTGTTAKKPKHFATGSANVRIPATLVVRPGGKLSPPQISIPARIAVQVTVISKDGRAHRVLVMTPTREPLSVPANGRASVLIPGLRTGRYPIELDGTTAGLLVTGVQPGP
jgi:hypothetical protein